jgi:hypothetical protein
VSRGGLDKDGAGSRATAEPEIEADIPSNRLLAPHLPSRTSAHHKMHSKLERIARGPRS